MSSGRKNSDNIKPATATSVFSGVKNSTIALPGFGTASSQVQGDKVNNSFTPDAQVSTMLDGAKQGVLSNQAIFNLTPEQQFAQVESSPFYKYGAEQDKRFLNEGQAEARQAASSSGLENSTIAGAIEASLLQDAAMRDYATRLGAIDYSRGIAAESLGVNQGIMDQIYGYTMEPMSLSGQTLMDVGDNQDQMSMFNAGQIQQSRMMNAQLAAQAAQRRSALIGNIISGVGTIAGGALTGGIGTALGAGLASKLGPSAMGIFTQKANG